MAILNIADIATPYSGNFIASLRQLGRHLTGQGHRFILAFPRRAEKAIWLKTVKDEFPVYLLPDSDVLLLAARIAEIASLEKAKVVHTHFTTFDVPAQLAADALRMQGQAIRVLWHYHSVFPIQRTLRRRVKDLIKYELLGRRTCIIGVSEAVVQHATCRGARPRNIRVVENGIDTLRACNASACRDELRRRLAIPSDTTMLLAFAWEPTTKGADIVVEAAERLHVLGARVVLCLVGQERTRDFVTGRFGATIPEWLRCLPPAEMVGDLFGAADIFVAASRWEGFSYSVGEAMANALPVVMSDIQGHSWAFEAPAARVFPSGDAAALCRVLASMLEAKCLHQGGVGNRLYASARLSLSLWADKITNLYENG